ncbi:unnamed protein product [Caenorhabditis auriculariae]|uniref:7-dehydrocholesterol reductase n=1 Tax=Caenorhabditis auriculariae TaxID=2777116 RepID=A0A8S1H0N7_9PELO|nr:unnamed protein product [Caenorhabditis auriculariae]
MQRVRRSSYTGSTASLHRRSSISAKDVVVIQQTIKKQQKMSAQVVAVLLTVLPVFTFVYLYSISLHAGQLLPTLKSLFFQWPFLFQCIPPLFDLIAWKFTTVLFGLQLIFHWVLPHDTVTVISSAGDETKFVNGFFSCLLLCLLYVLGASTGFYRGDLVLVHYNSIIMCLAIICVIVLLYLCVCYHYGDGNNVTTLSELYFGIETHTRILDVDVKHFIRSRMVFSLWPLLLISSIYHQFSIQGKISKSLFFASVSQALYVLRLHWHEDLYLNSIDAKRTNCGFYRLWSDMVFYPVIYGSPTLTLAQTSSTRSFLTNAILFFVSTSSILTTAMIDRQKYEFRKSKGTLKFGGTDPFFITAKFKMDNGEPGANLLLGSGYWAICRHPNYLSEAVTFATFCAFQGFPSVLSYFPVIFVIGYLLARLIADESRCSIRYGQYWQQHCSRVKYRILPGFF